MDWEGIFQIYQNNFCIEKVNKSESRPTHFRLFKSAMKIYWFQFLFKYDIDYCCFENNFEYSYYLVHFEQNHNFSTFSTRTTEIK